jgi:hypothetical protein
LDKSIHNLASFEFTGMSHLGNQGFAGVALCTAAASQDVSTKSRMAARVTLDDESRWFNQAILHPEMKRGG